MKEPVRNAGLVLFFAALHGMAAAAPGYDELAAQIKAGNTGQVEALLKAGVSPTSGGPANGSAPLLLAASRGKHDIAKILLDTGAEPNPRYAAYYNATALMLAVNNRDVEMTRILLDGGAAVDLVDSNGDPALNWATFYGDARLVEMLLQRGAKATLVGHGNALEVAMRRGHQALVERFVDYLGLRKTLTAHNQALADAIQSGKADAIDMALKAGADASGRDATGRPFLALAARLGHADAVERLLAAGAPVDITDSIGFTPLFEACRDGRTHVARALLAHGANVRQKALPNGLGLTALHLAASTGRQELMRDLVARGAEIDALDTEQATPLMWAVGADRPSAKLLVEMGADPDLATKDGKSPRSVAAAQNMTDLLEAFARKRKG